MNELPELSFEELPELKFEEPVAKPQAQEVKYKSPLDAIGIGQVLSGNIPGALARREATMAVEQPGRGLQHALGLGGVAGVVMAPVSTASALGASALMETPLAKKASEISQPMVGKIPQQLVGFPEPFLGAIGAAGEIARKATPEQYRGLLKAGVSSAAAGLSGVRSLDAKYRNWATSLPQRISMGEHNELMNIASETKDIGRSAIGEVKSDIATFRKETSDVPIDTKQTNEFLYSLYGGSPKAEKAINKTILPKEFLDDMGNLAKEEAPKAQLGLLYKIKDTISKHIKWRATQPSDDQAILKKAYFDLDGMIDSSLEKAGKIEEKTYLDALNQVAEQAYDLSGSIDKMTKGISKTIPSPTKLLTATKGTEGYQILRQVTEFQPKMEEIITRLNKIRDSRAAKQLLKHVGIEAGQGVGMGAVMGKIMRQ